MSTARPSPARRPKRDAPARRPDGDERRLGDIAYDHIHELVTTVLAPGTRVSEAELAAQLQMSKTPVREALRRLESEALVEPIPRVGYLVAQVSYREVREAFEARAAIEGYAARLAASQIDDATVARLRESFDATAAKLADGPRDVDEMRGFNDELHGAIIDLADNQLLRQMLASIRIKIIRPINRFIADDADRFKTSFDEHRAILEALASRDPDASERAVREHIDSVARHILTRFR